MREHKIIIDCEKCVGCGACKLECSNIDIKENKAEIILQNCIKCGHCVAVCPKNAISMTNFAEQPMEIEMPTTINPQELMQALKTRRSIRRFKDIEVESEIIDRIIEAGRWTPTAKNDQDVSYVVLREKRKDFEKLAVKKFKFLKPFAGLFYKQAKTVRIDDDFFFKKAPIAIVVVSKNKINGSIAASNMALMAEACGLGVLYSGFFTIAANSTRKLRKMLGLKGRKKVVTTLVLGYSNVKFYRTPQRELADVVYK